MKNQAILNDFIKRYLDQLSITKHPEYRNLCSMINSRLFEKTNATYLENLDQQIIGRTFEKVHFPDFSEVISLPAPRYPGQEFEIFERGMGSFGELSTTKHSLVAEESPLVRCNLDIPLDFIGGSIDYCKTGIEKVSDILAEQMDIFYIKKLISELDNNDIYVDIADIRKGDKVLDALVRADIHTIGATSISGIDYILINPMTHREMNMLRVTGYGYQWVDQFPAKFIESTAIPEKYIYTVCYKPGKTLGFVVGILDFLLCRMEVGGPVSTVSSDCGVANTNFFSRIKIK